MDRETLNRFIGIQGLTSQELAEASGCCASMINTVSPGSGLHLPGWRKSSSVFLLNGKTNLLSGLSLSTASNEKALVMGL